MNASTYRRSFKSSQGPTFLTHVIGAWCVLAVSLIGCSSDDDSPANVGGKSGIGGSSLAGGGSTGGGTWNTGGTNIVAGASAGGVAGGVAGNATTTGTTSASGATGIGGSGTTAGTSATGGTSTAGATTSIGGTVVSGGTGSSSAGMAGTGGSSSAGGTGAIGGVATAGSMSLAGTTSSTAGTSTAGTSTAGTSSSAGGVAGGIAGGGSSGASNAVSATNSSTSTLCAEEDNVDVLLSSAGAVPSYTIEATHPTYDVGVDNCEANFTQCATSSDPQFTFTAENTKLFDDGETVVFAERKASWWRSRGMTVTVDSAQTFTDAHLIKVSKRIPGANEWPEFLAFYMDGNMRLIPFPPVGKTSVCFGSSVLVGPITPGMRPIAEVASVNFVSASKMLQVIYVGDATAKFALSDVSRTRALVRASVAYTIPSVPFVAFRSMFVSDGNSDVDHVSWTTISGTAQDSPISGFPGGAGREWFFYRATRSVHNTSAPDIRITVP